MTISQCLKIRKMSINIQVIDFEQQHKEHLRDQETLNNVLLSVFELTYSQTENRKRELPRHGRMS